MPCLLVLSGNKAKLNAGWCPALCSLFRRYVIRLTVFSTSLGLDLGGEDDALCNVPGTVLQSA